MSIAPIRPEQVVELKGKIIPPEVIQSFNEAIAENFLDGRAQVPQNDVIGKIVERLGIDRSEIFRRKLLDVEPIFREAGWDVHYDKPGYNEDYEAFFVFKQRRGHR